MFLVSLVRTKIKRQVVKGKSINKQSGFTMIEVLVSVLIFAIGLLGIAGLQSLGMRMTRDADLMGQANLLVVSMADKMRGDSAIASGGTVSAADIAIWNTEIQKYLPSASGSVTSASNIHTITVNWTESQDSNQTDSERTYSLAVRI